MFQAIQDVALLLFLGMCGWGIFTLLHLPAAPMLGTIFTIGAIRALGYPLPEAPDFLGSGVQIMMGIFVGARITKEALRGMKALIKPSIILVTWTLSMIIVLGMILYRMTNLDLYTALLSSSMGGLAEMTILALDTNADIGVVIIMQTTRMILTTSLVPFLVKRCTDTSVIQEQAAMSEAKGKEKESYFSIEKIKKHIKGTHGYLQNVNGFIVSIGKIIPSLVIAALGGYTFMLLGVPAGAMIGAMFFIAAASIRGVKIVPPSGKVFPFLMIGLGTTIADNITDETVAMLMSGEILMPLLLATGVMFATSFFITWLFYKHMGWDLATSFLVTAPGGFSVMTSLAIKYNKDAFTVSMLHLCRLLAIKIVVPFAFMALL